MDRVKQPSRKQPPRDDVPRDDVPRVRPRAASAPGRLGGPSPGTDAFGASPKAQMESQAHAARPIKADTQTFARSALWLAHSPIRRVDWRGAQAAYDQAIDDAKAHHCQVTLVGPDGVSMTKSLGVKEDYGVHRAGSVTKTFTSFCALKLANDGVLPHGLETCLGDVVPEHELEQVFEQPELAASMTLKQLLSHTAGLEGDDHSRSQRNACRSLNERFLTEATSDGGRKYAQEFPPGVGAALYSNAAVGVAGWLMERAYNHPTRKARPASYTAFADIMKTELLDGVFGMKESKIAPGPTKDIVQGPAGDLWSSTGDLAKAAKKMQGGESALVDHFGPDWQAAMQQPQDLLGTKALGTTAGKPYIGHFGMNSEDFDGQMKTVTAMVQLPLDRNQPAVVAMTNSSALGPAPREQVFVGALQALTGERTDVASPAAAALTAPAFTCPEGPLFLHRGTAVIVTDKDPFGQPPPQTLSGSRNGAPLDLVHTPGEHPKGVTAFQDKVGNPWFAIQNGKVLYSKLAITSGQTEKSPIGAQQRVEADLDGHYQSAEDTDFHPQFDFVRKDERLYLMQGGTAFPCLFVPDQKGPGGVFVPSGPGPSVAIRFPDDPDHERLKLEHVKNGEPFGPPAPLLRTSK